ncbi:MAG: Uncharacterised protein [Owenweeksia sp. TMED14]|nr:MAG: Uncharacterised protein [Owenweeksia sp. TMED14]
MKNNISKYDLWLGISTGAILALVPSFEKYSKLGDPSHWPLQLGWSLLVLFTILNTSRKSQLNLFPNPLLLIWILFIIWCAIGYFASPITALSEWKLSIFRYSGYFGFLFLGASFHKKGETINPFIAHSIIGFGGMISLHYLAEFITTSNGLIDPYSVPGLMGHKNFTSSAIAITVPISILMLKKNRKNRFLYLTIITISIISIILTQTRSIALAGALSLIVAAIAGWRPNKNVWIAITGVLCIAIGLFTQPEIKDRLLDPTNLKIRTIFWNHSLKMVCSSPIQGVGSGQWRVGFPKYGLQGTNPSVAEGITSEVRPHNDFLWILAENGWIGFGIFSTFFIFLWFTWFKGITKESDIEHQVKGAILTIITVYSLFEFPIERIAVYGPFMIIAGSITRKASQQINSILKKLLLGVCCTSLLMLIYSSTNAIKADRDNQIVLENNSNQDASKIISSASKAISSWNELDRFGNPLLYFAGMGSMVKEAKMSRKQKFGIKDFKKAEMYFLNALKIHPNHVVTLYQLGNLYTYRGQFFKAKKTYNSLLKISPRHPGGQLAYSMTLLELNKPEASARIIISAFLSPDIYLTDNYKNTVIKALRQCPENTSHIGLQKTIKNRSTLNDQQLFNRFQSFKMGKIIEKN